MANTWQIFGQVGKIQQRGGLWSVDMAENRYDDDGNKLCTMWFNCLCKWKPNVETGQSVLAVGTFEPSLNKNYQYAMMISHIGVILNEK